MAIHTAIAEHSSEAELARAGPYRLLSSLLAAAPNANVLDMLRQLRGDPSDIGQCLDEMGAIARQNDVDSLRREYHDLFIGVGRGELVPFASFYLTGFLHEKPLAILRDDLSRLGIARRDEVSEPEDHIAALCEVMAGLITGELGPANDNDSLITQQKFFDRHLDTWAERFGADLESAKHASFYAPVGKLIGTVMQLERTAFSFIETDQSSATNTPKDDIS